ncbi:hypothetical protein PoB_001803500 [Plakobranchus ocellatus]|uniref:Uncharacterized protein n=1 Tax=Plakobranchus ocellatus TaxID=259542 RepID=A0AAV3Z8P6_9GAST|nr:hypothetical protein PoB_001803500 [Plakobranchus ocellatus]
MRIKQSTPQHCAGVSRRFHGRRYCAPEIPLPVSNWHPMVTGLLHPRCESSVPPVTASWRLKASRYRHIVTSCCCSHCARSPLVLCADRAHSRPEGRGQNQHQSVP